MKITQEEQNQFEHAARQFYLRCAKDAMRLAPLPEFNDALGMLEWYDDQPTKENRKQLMKLYRQLRKGHRDNRRAYGYSAVGCFYDGLVHILARTLLAPTECCSSSSVYFAEAFYCAGREIEMPLYRSAVKSSGVEQAFELYAGLAEKAQHAASDRYWNIYSECFRRELEQAA